MKASYAALFSLLIAEITCDPCSKLCDLDGLTVCNKGSWDQKGFCQHYLRLPTGRHCYHNSNTAKTCHSELPRLSVQEAEAIVRSFTTATSIPLSTTSTIGDVTTTSGHADGTQKRTIAATSVQSAIPVRISPGSRGVANLGFTCYFGAMLQVLSHSLKFRQFLESHPSVNTNMVETQLRAFMARMWAPENDERYITPVEFFDALHRIRPLEFRRETMSDANEALITILDELADSLIPLPSDATASIDSSSLRDSNILNSVFAVHDTQTLTCLECFRVSETHTRVSQMILSLPDVGEQAGAGSSHLSTLYELFATYTGEEIIPEYECEHCSPIRRMAGQTHHISNTSDIVSITLNRFTAAGLKNRTPVRIPLVLDMDLVPGSTATGVYKLVGVVYHFGRSRDLGHYTAHVLNSQSTQWLNMDDSVVTPLPRLGSNHTAIVSEDAYMLMYDRME